MGDVQRDTVMSQVEKIFGAWAQGTVEPDNFTPPPERTVAFLGKSVYTSAHERRADGRD